MSSRPAQIIYVKEGKALGAAIHKGWAATWNWVLSWVNHITGGKGCKIENKHSGNPRVDVLIEGGDGIEVTCDGSGKPYKISYVGGSGGGDGGGDDDPETPDYPSAPVITAEDLPDGTHIYADGVDIATIPHGHTPQITASKSGKTTTISVDGVPLCTIEDGEDGQDGQGSGSGTDVTVITGISFAVYNGKLVATLEKSTVKAISATSSGTSTVDVCDVEEVTVVTAETYNTGTHQFTNSRAKVKVLGSTSVAGQTPFTATAHSNE